MPSRGKNPADEALEEISKLKVGEVRGQLQKYGLNVQENFFSPGTLYRR